MIPCPSVIVSRMVTDLQAAFLEFREDVRPLFLGDLRNALPANRVRIKRAQNPAPNPTRT